MLLVVHATEAATEIVLPELEGARYVSLWSSADERQSDQAERFAPGDVVPVAGASMRLFRVD